MLSLQVLLTLDFRNRKKEYFRWHIIRMALIYKKPSDFLNTVHTFRSISILRE